MSNRSATAGPDLVAIWAEHTAQEFVHKDVDATMRTMTADAQVINVPVAMGGRGAAQVRDFYAGCLIGRMPRDTALTLLSRTVGAGRLVDEMLLSFTHDIEMPAMLPGLAPTGRRVTIPMVAIVGFREDRIESEHIYWDQASVLAQIGVLPRLRLPVLRDAQAQVLLEPAAPLNFLLASTRRERQAGN